MCHKQRIKDKVKDIVVKRQAKPAPNHHIRIVSNTVLWRKQVINWYGSTKDYFLYFAAIYSTTLKFISYWNEIALTLNLKFGKCHSPLQCCLSVRTWDCPNHCRTQDMQDVFSGANHASATEDLTCDTCDSSFHGSTDSIPVRNPGKDPNEWWEDPTREHHRQTLTWALRFNRIHPSVSQTGPQKTSVSASVLRSECCVQRIDRRWGRPTRSCSHFLLARILFHKKQREKRNRSCRLFHAQGQTM